LAPWGGTVVVLVLTGAFSIDVIRGESCAVSWHPTTHLSITQGREWERKRWR